MKRKKEENKTRQETETRGHDKRLRIFGKRKEGEGGDESFG
jgi:hypothetical protein